MLGLGEAFPAGGRGLDKVASGPRLGPSLCVSRMCAQDTVSEADSQTVYLRRQLYSPPTSNKAVVADSLAEGPHHPLASSVGLSPADPGDEGLSLSPRAAMTPPAWAVLEGKLFFSDYKDVMSSLQS